MICEPLIIEGEASDEQEAYYLDLFHKSNESGRYIPYLQVNGKTFRLPPFWDDVARSRGMASM
jgi:hypothetical protein